MLAYLRQRAAKQAAQIRALQPVRSPGTQTSILTRGVIRRVKVTQTATVAQPTSNKPRWG